MNATSISVGKCTHVGQVRSRNEDAMDVRDAPDGPLGSLFVVADGMGGHSAGNVASRMAVEGVMKYYYDALDEPKIGDRLRRSVEEANREIFESAQSNIEYFRMGTTLIAAAVLGNRATIANVGDSRVYLVRDGEIRQITRDHSWVALQVEMGELTPEEAQTSQNRSVLLRCMGEKGDVLVDIVDLVLRPKDILVLCTDGLHGLVSSEEIKEGVLATDPQPACDALVDLANQRGGPDNITVEVVRIDDCVDEPEEAAASLANLHAGSGGPASLLAGMKEPFDNTPAPAKPAQAAGDSPVAAPPAAPQLATSRPAAAPPVGQDPLANRIQWLSLVLAFLAGVIVALVVTELARPTAPDQPAPSPAVSSAVGMPGTVVPSGAIPGPLPSGTETPAGPLPTTSSQGTGARTEEGVLVVNVHDPLSSLVARDDGLFWLEGTPARIRRLALASSQEEGLGADPDVILVPPGRGTALAVTEKWIFLAREKAVLRFIRPAVPPPGPLRADGAIPAARGARSVGVSADRLFWLSATSREIVSTSLEGGRPALLYRASRPVLAMVTGPAEGSVFWSEEGGGIYAAKSRPARAGAGSEGSHGGAPRRLVEAPAQHLAADATHLYWTEDRGDESSEARLRRCRLDGSALETLATIRGPVLGLAVDARNVYWVVSNANNFSIKRMEKPASTRE